MGRPVPGARRPGRLFGLVLAVVLAAGAGAVLAWPGTIISSTIIRGATTMAAQTPRLTGPLNPTEALASTSGWFVVATTGTTEGLEEIAGNSQVEHATGSQYSLLAGIATTDLSDTNNAIAWGPYATKAEAEAAQKTLQGNNPGLANKLPAPPVSSPWAALDAFLSNLESGSLWLRVGEAIAGIVLLGIAANAIFKGKPLTVVTSAAGLVAKAVPK